MDDKLLSLYRSEFEALAKLGSSRLRGAAYRNALKALVVELCREGGTVETITESLRNHGLMVAKKSVQRILVNANLLNQQMDSGGIKPKVIDPEEVVRLSREEGESAQRIVRILRGQGFTVTVNNVHDVLREAGLSTLQGISGRSAEIDNLEGYAKRWDGGAGESIHSLAWEAGVSSGTLIRRFGAAGYSRRLKAGVEVSNLPALAKRWIEGESLEALAPEAGVSPPTLKSRFEVAGYERMRYGKRIKA